MKCPECKSNNVIRFWYGYPADIEEYLQLVAEGKIIPGGCTISNNSPKYYCKNCNLNFGRLKEKEILGEDNVS